MTEHTPSPGSRWETTITPVERVVDDDQPDQPDPRPNRAARRELARRRRAMGLDTLPDITNYPPAEEPPVLTVRYVPAYHLHPADCPDCPPTAR